MTSSLTKYDLETFLVKNGYMVRHYPLGVVGMFDKVATYASEDQIKDDFLKNKMYEQIVGTEYDFMEE